MSEQRISLAMHMRRRAVQIEAALDRYLPPADTPPLPLARAMRYSMFAGGKRLRPILVLETCAACGGDENHAMPAACALEMIHTYSLIHDDLPCMDDDDWRRGEPTSHKVFGEAIAVLAGDALLNAAFTLLAEELPAVGVDAAAALRVTLLVGQAAGADGMIGGQVADMQAESGPPDAAALQFIHSHKTGALLRASVEVGAVLAGADEGDRGRLVFYGEQLGLAFQIVDDILDVEGNAEALGKSTASDDRQGKLTFPAVYGVQQSYQMAGDAIDAALRSVASFGPEADRLRELARFVVARKH